MVLLWTRSAGSGYPWSARRACTGSIWLVRHRSGLWCQRCPGECWCHAHGQQQGQVRGRLSFCVQGVDQRFHLVSRSFSGELGQPREDRQDPGDHSTGPDPPPGHRGPDDSTGPWTPAVDQREHHPQESRPSTSGPRRHERADRQRRRTGASCWCHFLATGEVRLAILIRLLVKTPCPAQVRAPSSESIRVRSHPYCRLRLLTRPSQPVRHFT